MCAKSQSGNVHPPVWHLMTLREQAANKVSYLRKGDTLTVKVFRPPLSTRTSKMPFNVIVECSRAAWPSEFKQGRRTSEWFIGHSRTQESAMRRANKLIQILKSVGGRLCESQPSAPAHRGEGE